jgi:HNH endonuclease
VLSPGTLLPWLDGATFERLVFGPGQRVECSVKARFFAGATRRAIEVRDQGCTHEFCEEPVENCQIDHIVLYSQGGETSQENGQALCGFHNRLRNGREPPDG